MTRRSTGRCVALVADPPSTIARAWQRSSRPHRPSTTAPAARDTGRGGRRGERAGARARRDRLRRVSPLRAAGDGCRWPSRPPGRGALHDGSLVAGRGPGPHAPGTAFWLRPSLPGFARGHHSPDGERRRGVRVVQGRQRVLLRTDGRARVPPGAAARLRLVGGSRGRLVRRHPLGHLDRHRDDRVRLVSGDRLGPLRDRGRAWSAQPCSGSSPSSGRLPSRSSFGRSSGPLRDVDRGARHPLADRTMVETTDAGRPHPLLADGVAARAGDARLRREARVGRGRIELVRLLCGALAGLRPPRRRAMVRLPPRGLRRLPRHRSGRSRADRALGPRARREGGIPAGGRVRGAVRRGERHRTARGRGIREQPVGLRPAPRPLRVLPPPPLAHRPRSVARLRPASPAHRVDHRSRRGARARVDPTVRTARERGGHRHRPGRVVGAGRGGARGTRAGIGPPRARHLRRRALGGNVPPAAEDRAGRPARGGGRHLRRHVVLRVGAHGRGARGPRLRGRLGTHLDRRAGPQGRHGDEALRGHAVRLRRSSGTRST